MLYWCLTHGTGWDESKFTHSAETRGPDCEVVGLIRTDGGLLFADRCDTCDGKGHKNTHPWPPPCSGCCPAGCVNGWKVRAATYYMGDLHQWMGADDDNDEIAVVRLS